MPLVKQLGTGEPGPPATAALGSALGLAVGIPIK